jgi:hypothetical protein
MSSRLYELAATLWGAKYARQSPRIWFGSPRFHQRRSNEVGNNDRAVIGLRRDRRVMRRVQELSSNDLSVMTKTGD